MAMTMTICAEPHSYLVTCEAQSKARRSPLSGTSRWMDRRTVHARVRLWYMHVSVPRKSSIRSPGTEGGGVGGWEARACGEAAWTLSASPSVPPKAPPKKPHKAQNPVWRQSTAWLTCLPIRTEPPFFLPTDVQPPCQQRMASIEPCWRDRDGSLVSVAV